MGNRAVKAPTKELEDDVSELESITCFERHELEVLYSKFVSLIDHYEAEKKLLSPTDSTDAVVETEVPLVATVSEAGVNPKTTKVFNHYTMNLDCFKTMFPFNDELIHSLFRTIDENGDGSIQFREFVAILSIICRGSIEDKTLLAYQLCDLKSNGVIERSEMEAVLQQLNTYISQCVQNQVLISPQETIETLFSKKPPKPQMGRNLHSENGISEAMLKSGNLTFHEYQHQHQQPSPPPEHHWKLEKFLKHLSAPYKPNNVPQTSTMSDLGPSTVKKHHLRNKNRMNWLIKKSCFAGMLHEKFEEDEYEDLGNNEVSNDLAAAINKHIDSLEGKNKISESGEAIQELHVVPVVHEEGSRLNRAALKTELLSDLLAEKRKSDGDTESTPKEATEAPQSKLFSIVERAVAAKKTNESQENPTHDLPPDVDEEMVVMPGTPSYKAERAVPTESTESTKSTESQSQSEKIERKDRKEPVYYSEMLSGPTRIDSRIQRLQESRDVTKSFTEVPPPPRKNRIQVVHRMSDSHLGATHNWGKVFGAIKSKKLKSQELLPRLSMRDFVLRVIDNTDLLSAFQIFFDFISKHLVEPAFVGQIKSEVLEKQGWILKKKSATLALSSCDKIYAMVNDGFFCYFHKGDDVPRKTISLQGAVIRKGGLLKDSHNNKKFSLYMLNYAREFELPDKESTSEWVKVLREQAQIRKPSLHRYHSFAGVRSNNRPTWFINGKDYFEDLALNGIEKAKNHIYIADWWLIPELQLIRNPNSDKPFPTEYRLDSLLEKKAREGVKICVLIWQETSGTYYLASEKSQNYLEGLHPNIKVILHPWIFPLKWSHHQKMVVIDDEVVYLGGIDLCYGRYDDGSFTLVDNEEKLYPGRDFTNYQWNTDGAGEPSHCVLKRETQPRMPWHDIQIKIEGMAAIDCSYNFIQRWNFALRTGKWQTMLPSPLLPLASHSRLFLQPHFHRATPYEEGTADCQIVRSASYWSAGIYTENSIYNAYWDLIHKASHFIYIQNQFFITQTDGGDVKNKLAKAIYSRIAAAIQRDETFRVIVILPVSPGGLEDPSTQLLLQLTYNSISRGGNSLLEKLAKLTDRPFDYISFHVLRNWDILSNGMVVDEQVYVHAKLMIVDDQVVIVGSANINDRSMRGSRDSEICAIVEDRNYITTKMNGKSFKASQFAFSLRQKLWQLHLGIEEENLDSIMDPVHESVFRGVWQATSHHNSELLSKVFPKSPLNPIAKERIAVHEQKVESEEVTTTQTQVEPKELSVQDMIEILSGLKGFLNDFPLDMQLKQETFQKEALLPKNVYS